MKNNYSDDPVLLSVRKLLGTFEEKYFIPIYQRNYAWRMDEVRLLLEDIADYARQEQSDWQNYYIGNLIVLREYSGSQTDFFETIDGQQRLTTLYIILSAIKNQSGVQNDINEWFKKDVLRFKNRKQSDSAMAALYKNDFKNREKCEPYILSVYDSVYPVMTQVCKDRNLSIDVFLLYLLNWVKILRVEVPEKIDKNHYFEVMNSRGVQLEQHEIVKARLMKILEKKDYYTFGRIWDASSNMEKYLQMNFSIDERWQLFGNTWTNLELKSFEEVEHALEDIKKTIIAKNADSERDLDSTPKSLSDIISDVHEKKIKLKTPSDYGKGEKTDQFYSVINFANFLLHVLKVTCPDDETITLDDKSLADTFDSVIKQKGNDARRFVKKFAINLLVCRTLYDKYIIRRRYSDPSERWCMMKLKAYKNDDGNYSPSYESTFNEGRELNSDRDELIILLSMFHVSSPAMIYKNWLCVALAYIFRNQNTTQKSYIDFLRKLSTAYMRNHYLVQKSKDVKMNERWELSEIVDDYLQNSDIKIESCTTDISLLNQGVAVENYIFNFYDYLIWKEKKPTKFSFTFRTSVEHFYPQHPSEIKPLTEIYKKDGEYLLNSFGNLCLISRSQNSKFTNDKPGTKCSRFGKSNEVLSQSLKLQEMFEVVKKNNGKRDDDEVWLKEEIEAANDLALKRFNAELETNFSI